MAIPTAWELCLFLCRFLPVLESLVDVYEPSRGHFPGIGPFWVIPESVTRSSEFSRFSFPHWPNQRAPILLLIKWRRIMTHQNDAFSYRKILQHENSIWNECATKMEKGRILGQRSAFLSFFYKKSALTEWEKNWLPDSGDHCAARQFHTKLCCLLTNIKVRKKSKNHI